MKEKNEAAVTLDGITLRLTGDQLSELHAICNDNFAVEDLVGVMRWIVRHWEENNSLHVTPSDTPQVYSQRCMETLSAVERIIQQHEFLASLRIGPSRKEADDVR